jgi:hypothetical protein
MCCLFYAPKRGHLSRTGVSSTQTIVNIRSTVNCGGEFTSVFVRDLYFGPKPIFIPPLLWKWYFFASLDTSFFNSYRGLFALNLPYFALDFPFFSFYSPFFNFLSFSSSFFPLSSLFFYIFPLFLFNFLYFFLKWHWLIFFPPGGGGIFLYIDPWYL